MTNICPARKRDCRGSNNGNDARFLVGRDFLLGDHGGQRSDGAIVIAQSSSGEGIETRVHWKVAIGLGGEAQGERWGVV